MKKKENNKQYLNKKKLTFNLNKNYTNKIKHN